MEGIVIKKNANIFSVYSNDKVFDVMPSGKTKEKGVYVGDKVEFEQTITSVKQRKNLLIRPPIANIEKMFIVVSPSPKPDFVLVDKMLVYCFLNKITPYLIINKCDIAKSELLNQIDSDYSSFLKVLKISAKNKELNVIENEIEGICALAGQSAVGKSSIINAIFGDEIASTGSLSKKIERGKQTTRIVKLYKIGKGFLADTAGFSLLDLNMISDIEKDELASYYPDFLEGRSLCKYRSCLHEGGECGIIKLVKEGKISKNRYNNYLKILSEIKNSNKY